MEENFVFTLPYNEILKKGEIPMFIDEDSIYFLDPEFLTALLKKCDFQHSKSFSIPEKGSLSVYTDGYGNSLIIETGVGVYERFIGEDKKHKISLRGIVTDRNVLLYDRSGTWEKIDLGGLLSIYQTDALNKIISKAERDLKKRMKRPDMYV